MTTDTIEDVDTMPLDQVQERLAVEITAFRAAKAADDREGMQEHYGVANRLAGRQAALTASTAPPAAPAVTAAGAVPAIATVVMPSAMVSTDEPRDSRPTDDGWSSRCSSCRQSYHDAKIKLVAVHSRGVVVRICPRCRERMPHLQPA